MMVVAVRITGELKAPTTFREFQLLQQAHATEKPKGSVHGGEGDPFLGTQKPLVHLFSTQVTAFPNPFKQGQNTLTLGGQPLAAIMKTGSQPVAPRGRWQTS
jgi:hypothetical protein